jgi:hypothetical protein
MQWGRLTSKVHLGVEGGGLLVILVTLIPG